MESPQPDFIRSRTAKEYDVPGDQRTTRIEILFTNGSRLTAREYFFYDTERTKYSYHWMRTDSTLIIRWDNAHPVPFDTSPHHQHVGSEENVQPSESMTLEAVLTFITLRLSES